MTEPGADTKSPRLVAAMGLCVVVLALVTSRGPPLGQLDAILFSHYNNMADPAVLMYFNGWIHVVPELVAWLVRALPAVAQFALYVATAFASAFLMQRELQKLLALWFGNVEAAILSLVALVYFQLYLPVLNQLTWCIWPLAVAACCLILRRNLTGEAFSWFGLTATALACLTNPTALVLIPLLGLFAWTATNRILRWQNAALALLLVIYFAAMAAFKPDDARYLSGQVVHDAARALWQQLKAPLWQSLPIALMAGALAVLGWALLVKRFDATDRKAILALAWLGFASLALFLFSGRAAISIGLPARYTILCMIAALLALAIFAAGRLDERWRRTMVIVVAVGICVAEAALLVTRLPVKLRQIGSHLAFARAIGEFRSTCQPGEALTRTAQPPGFAVLCRRIDSASKAALPVVRHDVFGNVFVAGPPAKLWPSGAAATIELLSPQR